MKAKYILPIAFLSLVALLSSCDINRPPYNSMDASKIYNDPESYADYLLNGTYAQLKGWSDVMHRCGEYAGDNIMIRGSSTDSFYEFISFQRTPQNGRLNSFWNSSYKVIAQSSNIINAIEEHKSPEVDQKLGECYFLRGLMYFYLVRAYGRPYFDHPETNLGVPIVNGTQEDVFGKLPDRSTVKETYSQAIRDLEKSIELMQDQSHVSPVFASKEAAEAILSRVYLYMSGTYSNPNTEYARKAAEYARKVIESGKFRLLPREDFMKYNRIVPENNKESIFVVKRLASEFSGYDHYYGVGGMYANIGGMGWGEMYASASYLALLDETGRNDWANGNLVDARAAFIAPQYRKISDDNKVFRVIVDKYDKSGKQSGYSYLQLSYSEFGGNLTAKETVNKETHSYPLTAIDKEQGIYSFVYNDDKTYTGVLDYFIKLNRVYPMFYITKCSLEGEESHLHSPVISRLGEVYLNLAEAEAKLGNYSEALKALNTIRERSLPGKGYTDLTKENAEGRIDKERQLELAFQAERSYDVFRNGRALKRPYPGPHNAMEEIPATDCRVVYFIPQDAINAYGSSGSTLTQNPTSNS